MPKKGYRKCKSCGEWKTDVTDGYSPYDADVLSRNTPVTWCEACYKDNADDI